MAIQRSSRSEVYLVLVLHRSHRNTRPYWHSLTLHAPPGLSVLLYATPTSVQVARLLSESVFNLPSNIANSR